jgi:hypothetical protein
MVLDGGLPQLNIDGGPVKAKGFDESFLESETRTARPSEQGVVGPGPPEE